MQAYNIPEFVKAKIPDRMRRIKYTALENDGVDVRFGSSD